MTSPLSPPGLFTFPDLSGRTLVITGITRGIGRALLPYLAGQGLRLIAVSRDGAKMEGIRRELQLTEEQFVTLECDLGDPAAVEHTGVLLANMGFPIDGVLHNAAVDPRHWFEQANNQLWQIVLQVNLFSAVALTRHLLPALRRSDQGRILFTGSVISDLGGAYLTAYAASKGAVEAVTRALAHELQGSGITVNCLIPGAIQVEKEPDGIDEKLISWQSIPRRLTPRDLAGPICLLLSQWGGGMSGQCLTVDGGVLHPLASPEMQGRSLSGQI